MPILSSLLKRFFSILPRRGMSENEARDVWSGFGILFGILSAHTLLETARDALFLAKIPVRRLPQLYIAIAILSVVVTVFSQRQNQRQTRLVASLMAATIGTTVIGGLLRIFPERGIYLLYVWTGLVTTVLLTQFWLAWAGKFTVVQAKRVFGFIGAGSILGAIFGGLIARFLTQRVEPDWLILVASGELLCTLVITRLYIGRTVTKENDTQQAAFEWKSLMLDNPYMRRVTVVVMVGAMTVTVLDYLFKSQIAASVPKAELATFIATFYLGVNVASVIAQFVLSTFLLRSLGATRTLGLFPLLLLGQAILFLMTPLSWIAVLLKGTDGMLRHSLQRTSLDMLFVPLEDNARTRLKIAADIVGQKGGQAIASVAVIAIVRIFAAEHWIPWVLAILAVFWFATAVAVHGPYLELLRKRIRRLRLPFDVVIPKLDLESLETLLETVNSPVDTEVVAAINALAEDGKSNLIPALILYHPSDDVVVRALEIFHRNAITSAAPIARRISPTRSPRVRAAAIPYLAAFHSPAIGPKDIAGECEATWQIVFLVQRVAKGEATALRLLRQRLLKEPEFVQSAALRAMTTLDDEVVDELMVELIDNARGPDLRRQIVANLSRAERDSAYGLLIRAMRFSEIRDSVRMALVGRGEVARKAAAMFLLEDSEMPVNVRVHIPQLLAEFSEQKGGAGDRQSVETMVEVAQKEQTTDSLRHQILIALDRIARINRSAVANIDIERSLGDLVRRAYLSIDLLYALDSLSDEELKGMRDLMERAVREASETSIEVVLRVLQIGTGESDFSIIRRHFFDGTSRERAVALELIEQHLRGPIREALSGLLQDELGAGRLRFGRDYYKAREDWTPTTMRQAFEESGIRAVQRLASFVFSGTSKPRPSERPLALTADS